MLSLSCREPALAENIALGLGSRKQGEAAGAGAETGPGCSPTPPPPPPQDWWNSTSFSNYYRTWNVVVHDWLYSYVYQDALWVRTPSTVTVKGPSLGQPLLPSVRTTHLLQIQGSL